MSATGPAFFAALTRAVRCRGFLACLRDARGTATVEFALVFPVILGLTLILLQTALLMAGQLFVNYAAFTAARSAVVHIPADLPGGQPRNVIVRAPGDPKFDAIRHAAYIGVMPVSGEIDADAIDDDPLDAEALIDALAHYFEARGRSTPRWVREKVADRMRYARAATEVTLMRTGASGGEVWFTALSPNAAHAFAPREPVTVRIEHRFHLSIPYARAVFADGRSEAEGAYATVFAQYTLNNEGVDPALPEPPELRRSDQLDDDET